METFQYNQPPADAALTYNSSHLSSVILIIVLF